MEELDKQEEQEIKELARKAAEKDIKEDEARKDTAAKEGLKKEIKEKDWKYLNFVWPIALLLPPAFWLWPKIPKEWIPTDNLILTAVGIILAIAAWLKLRVIIKEMDTDNNISNASSKTVSSERVSINMKVDFECNEYSCKPLTKVDSSKNTAASAQKAMYRHEGKIKGDNLDSLLGPSVTNWGGSEDIGGSSGSSRGMQKKAPKR